MKYVLQQKIPQNKQVFGKTDLDNFLRNRKSSDRVEALHFGSADLAASMGAKITSIGGVNKNYGILERTYSKGNKLENFHINDIWHYALFKIVLTAHAFGLRAVDCPFGDFSDELGFNHAARSTYTLGFDGKMLIHPSQITLSNKIFSPTE